MKRLIHILLVILLVSSFNLGAQKYFVSFSDKNNNTYSISSPAEFLSQRAIDRRTKHEIQITEHDLPVTSSYLDSVKKMNVKVLWSSKWMNGLIVESGNQQLMDTITRVSFISDAKLIGKQPLAASKSKFLERDHQVSTSLKSAGEYGATWNQTQTVNGHYLHRNNYEGQDMHIAVLDNGFDQVNSLSSFTHLWDHGQIVSFRDIVNPDGDVFVSGSHGTNVLSIMGGFLQGNFKGAAIKASYHLIRTEDDSSEYPIEEYNWVIGAEYADSIGADIINSSLGYYIFDDNFTDYTNADMDGKTTIVVKGAEAAFSKGMMVVNSAGNEGSNSWKKIISPADGTNVLSVAAMQSDSLRASFSSYGPSADGRVKPDIAAKGRGTALQENSGAISYLSGTSFSAPVVTGFVTCLWQALPNLKNTELLQLVRESSHAYLSPDDSFGYGIPNFKKALGIDSAVRDVNGGHLKIFPNPFFNDLNFTSSEVSVVDGIVIYDIIGNVVYQQQKTKLPLHIEQLEALSKGIYLIQVQMGDDTLTYKIIKK